MVLQKKIERGNFTGLAESYSSYRPAYSQSVLKCLVSLLSKPVEESNFVDVGAGTGIWTRMISSLNPQSIVAIEPNNDMRETGERDSRDTTIEWKTGSGEATGLADGSVDMVSMASSFHWVNFEKGCAEFHRILKPGGRFVALWNPRLVDSNPLLKELEDYLLVLKSDLKRVSSGRTGLVETLTEKLYESQLFSDVVYLEGRHTAMISPAQYIGAWRSVNDVQSQLGPEKFEHYISYLEDQLSEISSIEVTYLTRAWSALKI